MIKHSVIFKLHYETGTPEERNFLQAAGKLSDIPGVRNFEIMQQVSKKNPYDFGISMEFENNQLYEQYSAHPMHENFIDNYWVTGVKSFLEIDYTALPVR